MLNIERPQLAIGVQEAESGESFMFLLVTTSGSQAQYYLGNADDYPQVAKQIHANIMKAGRDMRRAPKIEQVGVNLDGILKGPGAERRQHRSKGTPG